jgi:hypothetical protein
MRATVALAALVLALGRVEGQQPQEELKPGLIGEYFSFAQAIEEFPTVAAEKAPNLRRIDKELAFESTEGKFAGTDFEDQFFVRWTGVLRVPTAGKYTIYAESDDGSRVFVESKLVVDNGGLHVMEEKSGEMELKAGDHELRVEFFENTGGAGFKLSWEVKGMDNKKIIPASAFFHKKDKELDK